MTSLMLVYSDYYVLSSGDLSSFHRISCHMLYHFATCFSFIGLVLASFRASQRRTICSKLLSLPLSERTHTFISTLFPFRISRGRSINSAVIALPRFELP